MFFAVVLHSRLFFAIGTKGRRRRGFKCHRVIPRSSVVCGHCWRFPKYRIPYVRPPCFTATPDTDTPSASLLCLVAAARNGDVETATHASVHDVCLQRIQLSSHSWTKRCLAWGPFFLTGSIDAGLVYRLCLLAAVLSTSRLILRSRGGNVRGLRADNAAHCRVGYVRVVWYTLGIHFLFFALILTFLVLMHSTVICVGGCNTPF